MGNGYYIIFAAQIYHAATLYIIMKKLQEKQEK